MLFVPTVLRLVRTFITRAHKVRDRGEFKQSRSITKVKWNFELSGAFKTFSLCVDPIDFSP